MTFERGLLILLFCIAAFETWVILKPEPLPDFTTYEKLIGRLKDDNARLEEKDKVKQDSLDSKDRRLNEKDSLLTISRTNNRTKYEKVFIYVDRISNDSATDYRADLRRQFRDTH